MEYQIEMLRKHLGEKVKGVFYGSSIEVRDPISRQIEKKSLKPFLVNQTSLLLERGQLRIPHKDTSEIIHRQMTNFRVVRISEKNREPVYSSDDEHGLDAMIFALYAFMNDYPELINIIDKKDPAKTLGITQSKRPDPLTQMLKERIQSSESNSNELTSHAKKASLGFSKRPSRDSLGWGRRGSQSSKQGVKRRSF